MKRLLLLALAGLVACGGEAPSPNEDAAAPNDGSSGAPVVTNAESPVRYPPQLFERQVEGTVMLRLFVNAAGDVVPESTRVAESSGHPGLDSAALDAVTRMEFEPARRNGEPVATMFLQPIQFQHPERPSSGSAP